MNKNSNISEGRRLFIVFWSWGYFPWKLNNDTHVLREQYIKLWISTRVKYSHTVNYRAAVCIKCSNWSKRMLQFCCCYFTVYIVTSQIRRQCQLVCEWQVVLLICHYNYGWFLQIGARDTGRRTSSWWQRLCGPICWTGEPKIESETPHCRRWVVPMFTAFGQPSPHFQGTPGVGSNCFSSDDCDSIYFYPRCAALV